jgi:hypothetical protein
VTLRKHCASGAFFGGLAQKRFPGPSSIRAANFAVTKPCSRMADLVLHHRGLAELFREPAERLREFTAFELAPFVFHDSSRDVMRVHVFEGSDLDLAAGT